MKENVSKKDTVIQRILTLKLFSNMMPIPYHLANSPLKLEQKTLDPHAERFGN